MISKEKLFSIPHEERRIYYKYACEERFNQLQKLRTFVQPNGYTLRNCDDYECIFVHIPKAAGLSISKTLFGNSSYSHMPIREYQLVFAKEDFDSYFKFTFIRNPWDRLYSAYCFLKKGGMNKTDRAWANANIASYDNFTGFVKGWLNRKNIFKYVHFIPQYWFLYDPAIKDIIVDFVGFYENLNEDFQYIKNRLSMGPALTLMRDRRTSSGHQPHYTSVYTPETRDIVAEVYKWDIEYFGYSFDNASLESQLSSRYTGAASLCEVL